MLFDRIIEPALALPRAAKRAIALSMDAGLCMLTLWWALYLRLGEWVPLSGDSWPAAVAAPLLALPIFIVSGLYRAVFRYVSWDALATVTQAVILYGIVYSAIFTAWGVTGVPRTVGLIQPVLLLIAVGSSRAFGRYFLGGRYRDRLRTHTRKNVLIYGAGAAGRQLAAALADASELRVVGFIDDDRGLHGSVLGGVRVRAPEKLFAAVEELGVAEIFLALPSASRNRRNEILDMIRALGVSVQTLPGLLDLAHGRVTVNDLKPLDVEDLLGRHIVPPDVTLMETNNRGKTVLVTGAGGSIGSELCRQVLAMAPTRLILVEANEYALYDIHRELVKLVGENGGRAPEIVPLLASACDALRIRRLFAAWRPDTIYHAAAYKHVPLVEQNLIEGVRNNVLGTWVTALAAQECGASNFVLISTDKAVRPTNVMGASKRLAELILQALAGEAPATCFSMVRFGNVLGSSGSVVPHFRQQISRGGPVTVTHREVTRYFMTIPEAAQLVLQAGAMAKGGEVFVLDMGEPVKVLDLATRMVELSGLRVRSEACPDGDVEIVFTGLGPGEKLYEELLIGGNPTATGHPRVMKASENSLPLAELEKRIEQLLSAAAQQNVRLVHARLCELVTEYVPADEIVDRLYLEEQASNAKIELTLVEGVPGSREINGPA
jgi:FlaA1/EpsC-like NDP-sugar epimerase